MLGSSSIKQKNECPQACQALLHCSCCDLTGWQNPSHTPVDPPVHPRRGRVCSCWFLEKLCGLVSSFFVCQKQMREHWAFVSFYWINPGTMSMGTMRPETYIRVFSVGSGGTTSGSGCSSSGWQQSESKLEGGKKGETKSCCWMNSDVKWKVHHAPDIKVLHLCFSTSTAFLFLMMVATEVWYTSSVGTSSLQGKKQLYITLSLMWCIKGRIKIPMWLYSRHYDSKKLTRVLT